MKTIFGLVLAVCLASCAQTSNPLEIQKENPRILHQDNYPDFDSTFSVVNYTQIGTGVVTIHSVNNTNAYIVSYGQGTSTTYISAEPSTCTINGQMLYYNVPVWITLDQHNRIHATWYTNVITVDQNEQN